MNGSSRMSWRWTIGWATSGRGWLSVAAASLAVLVVVEMRTQPGRRAAFAVAFSPGGERMAAVSQAEGEANGRLDLWDVATGRRTLSVEVPNRALTLAFAPDGSSVATGSWNGRVCLWDCSTGRRLRSYSGLSYPVRGLAFTPDGRRLAAGASDGLVVVWDARDGHERLRFDRGPNCPVNSLAISGDGRWLVAAGGLRTGSTGLWDL